MDIKKIFSDLKIWASLHVVIGIGVPTILLFFFGCSEIKEEPTPIGPRVEPEVIAGELEKALDASSVYTVYKHQQVLYEMTQTLELGASNPYLYVKQEVTELKDTEESFSFVYNQTTLDPNDDTTTLPKVEEGESEKYPPKQRLSQAELALQGYTNLQNIRFFSEQKAETMAEDKVVVDITYHDFYLEHEIQAPPPMVSQTSDCRDVPNCQIRVTKMQFDQVYWYEDGSNTKMRFNLQISPDVPYLGKIIGDCVSTQVPYEQRTVHIKQCQNLLDFAYGVPPQQ